MPPGRHVGVPSWETYVDFRTRAMHRMAVLSGLELVRDDGLVGVLSREPGTRGGLLLTTPVAPVQLDAALQRGTPQWVALLPPAAAMGDECAARGWSVQEDRMTMALADLAQVRTPPLPDEVEVRPVAVRRGASGYPLAEAVRLAYLYGEEATPAERDLELEAQLLRTLTGIRFFAAVAQDGSCVGTAGSRVVDTAALVASVATEPKWRRRGIATGLTAIALRAAADGGASEAYLDATESAVGIYRRLGFAELGPVRWCERASGG